LRGDEIRGCWESLDAPGAAGTPARPTLGPAAGWALEAGEDRTPVRLRDFIEVRADAGRDVATRSPAAGRTDDSVDPPAVPVLGSSMEPRWSLWGDAEA
jgi:hypothetical protein